MSSIPENTNYQQQVRNMTLQVTDVIIDGGSGGDGEHWWKLSLLSSDNNVETWSHLNNQTMLMCQLWTEPLDSLTDNDIDKLSEENLLARSCWPH